MQHTCRGEIEKRGRRKTTAIVSQLFTEEGENMVYTDYVKGSCTSTYKTSTIAKLKNSYERWDIEVHEALCEKAMVGTATKGYHGYKKNLR